VGVVEVMGVVGVVGGTDIMPNPRARFNDFPGMSKLGVRDGSIGTGHLLPLLALFALIALVGKIARASAGEVVLVRSRVDGNEYLVRNLGDRQRAADVLGRLNVNVRRLIAHLEENHADDERTRFLARNWDPTRVTELRHSRGEVTSYTINKTSMVMCLRDKDTEDIEEFNEVMFVCLHECAHMAVPVDPATGRQHEGHGRMFWDTMRFLVGEAVRIGIYTHRDYSASPQRYCGITINATPLKVH